MTYEIPMSPEEYVFESEATERKFPDGLELTWTQFNDLYMLHKNVVNTGDHADMIKRHLIYGKEHDMPIHLTFLNEQERKWELDQTKTEMMHGALGMVTESIEFFDAVMNHIMLGKEMDRVNLLEEIGDMLWYQALVLRLLDARMGDVMKVNIEKLRKRYPDKFDAHLALYRDLDAERKVLEGNE